MNFSSDKLSLMYLSIVPALPNISGEKIRGGKNRINISTPKDMTHLFYSICSVKHDSDFKKEKLIVLCDSNKFSCIQHNFENNYQTYPEQTAESH